MREDNEGASKPSFWKKLRDRYRLTIHNASTFQELWSIELSYRGYLELLIGFVILVAALAVAVIFLTPIRGLVSGNSDELSERVVHTALQVDSLQTRAQLWDNYLANLQTILAGGTPGEELRIPPSDAPIPEPLAPRASTPAQAAQPQPTPATSSPAPPSSPTLPPAFDLNQLREPVRGRITAHFNPTIGHYATDVVAPTGTPVVSAASGTVIFASWELKAGYTVIVQHAGGVVTQYKHLHTLLTKTGEAIGAGAAIGQLGNSGTKTSGPHLHFELWVNGNALDPERFIRF